jgi:hypothetical protein
MGGPQAPDDPVEGSQTQAWLAVSQDPGALVTGQYFYHQRLEDPHPAAREAAVQDRLLDYCASLTGVTL